MTAKSGGYSLLEILVVLAIVSMLTAIILPRLSATYETWQWKNIREDVVQQIKGLALSAYRDGVEYHVNGSSQLTDIPSGVVLAFDPELIISNLGVCQGSILTINYKGRESRLQLQPPYCNVVN